MNKQLLLIVISLLLSAQVFAVNPLEIDGCTASEDGTWGHCCVEHDILYWIGGSREDRLKADERLKSCINKSGGVGEFYYTPVRVFGPQFWGKAFPQRDVNTLSEQELQDIQNELDLYNSIGRPVEYDFVIQESIMFKPLTTEQKELIRKYLTKYAQTQEYQDFVKTYEQALGVKPITTKFHD